MQRGGGIHPVGRLERVAGPVTLDLVSYGVDALGVVRLEKAGIPAEGGRHVAIGAGEVVEMGKGLAQRGSLDAVGVGGDVATAEHLGVTGQVNDPDLGAPAFPLLRHPGRR
ncbi:MAG: hypothetical protein QOF81_1921 [Acidimicrobiaceae bacterium]|nr:hypothetical protein [Acidimicrobiaceae bacterium]